MFRLNAGQIEAFRAGQLDVLEARRVRILTQWFPADCGRIGQPALREFVRSSARRAEELGAIADVDVSKYVTMEFIVGVDAMAELIASERERLPWCQPRENAPMLIDAVCRAGLAQLEGPDEEPEPPQPEYRPLPDNEEV